MNGTFFKVFSLFLDLHFKFSKFLKLEIYFYRQFAPQNCTEIETKADKQTAKSEFLRVLHLAFIYMLTNYQRAVMSNSLFLKRGGIIMRHK